MTTVPNFLDITINAVLRSTFIWKLYYKLLSIVTFTFTQIFDWSKFSLLYWLASQLPRLLDTASKFALFSVSGFKDEKFTKSTPMWKLKHANFILESLEYFCQISAKLILIIFSYTVSKLVHFYWETQCSNCYAQENEQMCTKVITGCANDSRKQRLVVDD